MRNRLRAMLGVLSSALILSAAACKPKPAPVEVEAPKAVESRPALNFPDAFSWDKLYDAKEQKLKLVVTLKDGYHAYAPGEKIGRPVNVTIVEAGGWRIVGQPTLPRGQTKVVGEIGKTQVLEGRFEIEAKLAPGKGPLAGELQMQLCTEHACDRPRNHAFSVDVPGSK